MKKVIALLLVVAAVAAYSLRANDGGGLRVIRSSHPQSSPFGTKIQATTYSPSLDVKIASRGPGILVVTAEAKVKNNRRDANYTFEFEIRSGGRILGKYRLDQPTFMVSAARGSEVFPAIRDFTFPERFATGTYQVYVRLLEDVSTVDIYGTVLSTESAVVGNLSNRVKVADIAK
jgi:hypothetical protein